MRPYSIHIVVRHTNSSSSSDPNDHSAFWHPWSVHEEAYHLQKNGVRVASAFGASTNDSTQSTALSYVLLMEKNDELGVMYAGLSCAKAKSSTVIYMIK